MRYFLIALGVLLLAGFFFLWTPDQKRETLAQRYKTEGMRFLQLSDSQVRISESGSNNPEVLVLLHGFGSSLETWDDWVKPLSSRYRVIRCDMVGFGLSGPASMRDYSDEADVRRIAEMLDQLHLDKVTLIGHSLGGRVAWNFAARFPARTNKLVLIAPDGFPDLKTVGEHTYALPQFAKLMKYVLPSFLVKQSMAPAYSDPHHMTDAIVQRYQDMLTAPGVRQALMDRMQQTMNTDPTERLKSITAPTLLMWGENDAMIPVENSLSYLKIMPQAKRVVIPKLGHLLFEEAPTKTLSVLTEFLEMNS
jgi:pimeloyl-ACP methyl ester carboxylesterase